MTATGDETAVERLVRFARRFDTYFGELLQASTDVPEELATAIRYSALAPGKRLRPFLVVRCGELCGSESQTVWPAAAAVESVHAFSLIHDDLPAMDNDDLRRGQLTCHKKFGEATAILAGDSLVVLAFEILVKQVVDSGVARRLCAELAEGAGCRGMIGGQALDILQQGLPPALAMTESIHLRKTAALFRAACRMGAVAGTADEGQIDRLGRFGEKLGRAFQIADDLLDVTTGTESLGKASGKDLAAGKQTYPRAAGIEQSIAAATRFATEAIAELDPFASAADDLRELARFVTQRRR